MAGNLRGGFIFNVFAGLDSEGRPVVLPHIVVGELVRVLDAQTLALCPGTYDARIKTFQPIGPAATELAVEAE